MYGNVSYQGSVPGGIGNNPGNVMAELMKRLMGGGMGGGKTEYGSPEGEAAMAKMLGLGGAPAPALAPAAPGGMSAPTMGAFNQVRREDNPPMPAGPMPAPMGGQQMVGMQPPVPMSKPMGMGLGGGPEEMRRRMLLAMGGG